MLPMYPLLVLLQTTLDRAVDAGNHANVAALGEFCTALAGTP